MAVQKNENDKYLLGIDVGTTSVKVLFVNKRSGKIEASQSAETKADVDVGDSRKSEQCVNKIFDSLNQLMNTFPVELKRKVCFIGISGQMHGVVLWNPGSWTWNSGGYFNINKEFVSHLVTWQDQRCSPEFLASLVEANTQQSLHSGYGLATMIWLQKNDPSSLQNYQYSGTIHDLLVSVLIQNEGEVVMTDQNASSWGYFNASEKRWDTEALLKMNFPTKILPSVKPAGTDVGILKTSWSEIPRGCAIGLAVGDSQASVLSILHGKQSDRAAVFNLSTSIQLTFAMPPGFEVSKVLPDASTAAIEYRPYFENTFLAVGAGLNGGNCLAFFVNTIKTWMHQFGHEVSEDKIWEVLLQEGMEQKTSDLVIQPTLRGERHDPKKTASVNNLSPGNFTLGHVMRSLCTGVIKNLQEILPPTLLHKYEVQEIYATGSAVLKNRIMQEELAKNFKDFKIEFCDAGDSAYGAALMGL